MAHLGITYSRDHLPSSCILGSSDQPFSGTLKTLSTMFSKPARWMSCLIVSDIWKRRPEISPASLNTCFVSDITQDTATIVKLHLFEIFGLKRRASAYLSKLSQWIIRSQGAILALYIYRYFKLLNVSSRFCMSRDIKLSLSAELRSSGSIFFDLLVSLCI